jgi:transcriptional regulator with XRE-family HTH domain
MEYRQRMGFTQEQVALLVGLQNERTVRRFESGGTLPGSQTILRLGAALRVPVEFLYGDTYKALREEVRAREEGMPRERQAMLPLPI